jgi:trigger factor
MSCKVEDLGKNMVKLTIEATAEDFDKAIEKAYQKNKGKMNIQGFRKGKAPRAIIEKMYGVGVFYEDAANEIIPEAYEAAVKETDLEIVSRPEIDVVQVEKGKTFIFTAEVAVKPEVTLGQYKGVEVEKQAIEITEEEINAELDKAREQNSRTVNVEDRAVAVKDTAVIDFEGFVDGVAFAGGKGEDFELVIGSHSFIDTFEDQLVGKSIGEEVEVNVTFPTEYHAKELAGKPALFKVTIKSIKVKELPEADDDFAQDVSDFNTIAEYKEDIKKNLTEKKAKAAKTAKEDAVVDKIVENATMDIPSQMVDSQKRQMAEDFAQRLQMQGLSLEQYFQYTGMNPNKFMEDLEPQALKRIQSRLVLEAIVKAENIQIADEDVEKEFEQMAKTYQMELDKIKELIGEKEKEQIVMDMAVQKAIDLVTDSAKEA